MISAQKAKIQGCSTRERGGLLLLPEYSNFKIENLPFTISEKINILKPETILQ
jgi:hypothetical protein